MRRVMVAAATGVLAVLFIFAGALKLARSKPELVAAGNRWAEPFPPAAIVAIGVVECAAGLTLAAGLVSSRAARVAGVAAAVLAAAMVGAAATNVRRGDWPPVAINLVLLALALTVACRRSAGGAGV